jgi:catechol 2,3-dioxygenase-like lactoylglutathione lyase family enzyme
MGFELVKVVAAPSPDGGWSKHFFYGHRDDTGTKTGLIAFWELHDDSIGDDYAVDLNAAAGLPWWVNHLAFDAPTREFLEDRRDHWRACGHHVLEVDHEFCVSIYLRDPSGNMVEFCHSVRDFSDDEVNRAHELLTDPHPPMDADAKVTVWEPLAPSAVVSVG